MKQVFLCKLPLKYLTSGGLRIDPHPGTAKTSAWTQVLYLHSFRNVWMQNTCSSVFIFQQSPSRKAHTDLNSTGLFHCCDWLTWLCEPSHVTIPYTEEAICWAAGQPVSSWRPLQAADPLLLGGCTYQRRRSPRVKVMDMSECRAAVRLWKLLFPCKNTAHLILIQTDGLLIPATTCTNFGWDRIQINISFDIMISCGPTAPSPTC